ncbi:MAG TPA: tetratricopeptide repeat protein [Blastocatellia bacterium]|nr:tetratricopeptide repeat protein [Blastocatellia bacterium]
MKRVSAIITALFVSAALAAAVRAGSYDWEKAVSLYTQGQYRAAIAEFQKVVEEFPNHSDSWKYIGLAYYQLKEYEQAIAPLEKSLELKKAEGRSDPDTLAVLGRVQIALKRYDRALAYLENVTKQQPDQAANFYMLGVVYANLNRNDDAARSFRAALKLDPKDADSWYYLGILQFRAGRLDEAAEALRSGIAVAPHNTEMMTLLVEALLRRSSGETNERRIITLNEEAIRVATALKAVRDDATSTELLGRAFLAAKKYTNAEMTLSRALTMTKEPTAALYFNLGFAHAQNKAWARSAQMLENADKLNPNDANTLTYLGYVYENLRRYADALNVYTRAYEASGRSNADLKASIDRVTPFAKPQ